MIGIVDEIYEIIFFGRGGQGVKTASQMVADSLIKEGYFIQAFPEYGAERAGAPVRAFVRFSKKPITIHCPIEKANLAVVVDPTLIGSVDVAGKVRKDGSLLINSPHTAAQLKKELGVSYKVLAVDGSKISRDVLGKNMPNIVMLGSIAKLIPVLKIQSIKDEIKSKFTKKLGELAVQKNIEILDRGFKEVA
ncbi:2-oxoacid:acceptor oxidoreductase family protein [Candidatus Woesearchaeota archaeon]|nr:2-oxoacid:acceptor oxidoreductase family protein [Candidatus Woesearchaeota archaeon]